jgi:hypothetical protein
VQNPNIVRSGPRPSPALQHQPNALKCVSEAHRGGVAGCRKADFFDKPANRLQVTVCVHGGDLLNQLEQAAEADDAVTLPRRVGDLDE